MVAKEQARSTVRSWDPGQYRRFGSERSRPFYDLIAQIGAANPKSVVDIGCGPGELTASLSDRWPDADVLGIDSSPEMIEAAGRVLADEAASAAKPPRLRFELMDARDWGPSVPADVIVSNAMLQWLPDRESLLARWAEWLPDGGWLAVQMPANFDQPAHRLMRELADTARWRPLLADVRLTWQLAEPERYLDLLAGAGCAVNAWETTYSHVLSGTDPVLDWVKGTGLRPVLAALDQADKDEFLAEYGALLREAYPQRSYGTVLRFRRVFVVATKQVPPVTWQFSAR